MNATHPGKAMNDLGERKRTHLERRSNHVTIRDDTGELERNQGGRRELGLGKKAESTASTKNSLENSKIPVQKRSQDVKMPG